MREWYTGWKPREVNCSGREQVSVSPVREVTEMRTELFIALKHHGSPRGP